MKRQASQQQVEDLFYSPKNLVENYHPRENSQERKDCKDVGGELDQLQLVHRFLADFAIITDHTRVSPLFVGFFDLSRANSKINPIAKYTPAQRANSSRRSSNWTPRRKARIKLITGTAT